MPSSGMDPASANAADPQTATFAERGVAVPFTTPNLVGGRVRAGKAGLELVFANPSGARGTYVVAWAGVPDLSQPTLHDLQLLSVLGGLDQGAINPAKVRAAAHQVALDGAAGRQARSAALAAEAASAARSAATARHLAAALASAGDASADLPGLDRLAGTAAPLGFGPEAGVALIPQEVAALQGLLESLLAWAKVHADDAALARLVAALAGEALAAASAALAAARHQDALALVSAWRNRPDQVAAIAARPAWILDGWRLPGLVWADAAPGTAAALTEVAHMAPALPQEAQAWTGLASDPALPGQLRRMLAARVDGAVLPSTPDLVARNERFRALTV